MYIINLTSIARHPEKQGQKFDPLLQPGKEHKFMYDSSKKENNNEAVTTHFLEDTNNLKIFHENADVM